MPRSARYEIELRGRATERILRPVLDNFEISPTEHGTTHLVGEVRDPSHLNGLLAHFTSMNVEVVSLQRLAHPHPTRPESPRPPNTPTKGITS